MLSRPTLPRMIAAILICFSCALLPLASTSYLSADPAGTAALPPGSLTNNEETRKLLEQTLSSAEIEKEIARISVEQEALQKTTMALTEQAEAQKTAIADQREQAGAIIRSYYMGERDGLLGALLSAKNFSSMIALWDYYEIFIGRDRDILQTYEKQYKRLKATLQAAQRSSQELAALKRALEEQKVRVAALHQEIDNGVKDSSDPERLSALLQEFSLYWESVGLHEVKTYFKALAAAMRNLPDFVQTRGDVLVRQGSGYQLHLKEEDLNAFLRSQNELFTDFAFHFNDGSVTASGKSGKLSLSLTGHYTIQNEPVNAMLFHVDKIVFNGLNLPDTTNKSLEEEFDLGFYPSKIVSFLRATEVDSQDGLLQVKLSISF